ncbi:MAG: SDR family oxidoreductase [Candidatus Nanopelagicales bacterium]|nr:SDR family oxidoreductase [Candidatus Nanopelagicales bacterium]
MGTAVSTSAPKVAVVAGVSADIGGYVAGRLLDEDWVVFGTVRPGGRSARRSDPRVRLVECDFADSASVTRCVDEMRGELTHWDLVFSSVGTMEPIGPFFATEFVRWRRNLEINALAQLQFIHQLFSHRSGDPHIAFLAGGGTNGPFDNYSSYCASKILLIKMVELLHSENSDLNCFAIGPGFVDTKIHRETDTAGDAAGAGAAKTAALRELGGTDLRDIYAHLEWCMRAGRDVAGGRNHSTVHDPWGGVGLATQLRSDPDMYRLRRYRGFQPQVKQDCGAS